MGRSKPYKGINTREIEKQMTTCRECGAEIAWKRESGRWKPTNPDGSPHWQRCMELRAQAGDAQAALFEVPAFDLKGCKQCVPPWETCPHGCPIEFAATAKAA